MTYGELIDNPQDGIYKTEKGTIVLIEGSKIVHSPAGATIKDDERLEELE